MSGLNDGVKNIDDVATYGGKLIDFKSQGKNLKKKQ